jgi:serine/threonine protein kinase
VYEVRELLGKGTAGEVWRATHRTEGTDWAVKIIDTRRFALHPGFAGSREERVAELEQEARVMLGLRHGSIVGIKEFFKNDSAIYIVMELVRGGDLFDRIITRHCYPEPDARSLMLRLLSGVAYLHKVVLTGAFTFFYFLTANSQHSFPSHSLLYFRPQERHRAP